MLRRLIRESIVIEATCAPDLPRIRVDAALFENALLNLAINARDAMPDGGRLDFTVQRAQVGAHDVPTGIELSPGSYVRITVRDSGVGMSRDVLERACEPFFTTKTVGQGTGLGLSMVYGFMRQSGGNMALESAPGRGTAVRLYFPAVAAPASSASTAGVAQLVAMPARNAVVLVVEDDPDVRRDCVRGLQGLGYATLEASNGPEAIAAFAQAPRLDVLVTDVVMPGDMNGPAVAAAMRAHHPRIKVIYMSGYHGDRLASEPSRDGYTLLNKPFRMQELRAVMERVLA